MKKLEVSAETRRSISAIPLIASAIHQAIDEFGVNGVPSGELYAGICGLISFDRYQEIILILKGLDMVKESNYILTAVRQREV